MYESSSSFHFLSSQRGLLLQVELRGNRVCPVKPKMVLTSTVAIPPHTWVQLP